MSGGLTAAFSGGILLLPGASFQFFHGRRLFFFVTRSAIMELYIGASTSPPRVGYALNITVLMVMVVDGFFLRERVLPSTSEGGRAVSG